MHQEEWVNVVELLLSLVDMLVSTTTLQQEGYGCHPVNSNNTIQYRNILLVISIIV